MIRPDLYDPLINRACRPSRARAGVVVEVDHAQDEPDAEAGRDWVVRLRRGRRAVVDQRGLSATALAAELSALLGGRAAS